MADGVYDPTTENETPWEDHGIDHDGDDDDDEANTTQPFQPGASSTPYTPGAPYHPSEAHEMTDLPREQSSGDLTARLAMSEIKERFPLVNERKLRVRYKEAPRAGGGGGAVIEVSMIGKDRWHRLDTLSRGDTEKTLNKSLPKEIQNSLGISPVSQGPGDVAMRALKALFPDAKDVEAYLDKTSKRPMIKKPGANQPAYPLYTPESNLSSRRLNQEIPPDLRAALGESVMDQATALQKERDTAMRQMVQKRNKLVELEEAAQEMQERRQDLKNLRDRIKRLDDDIRELEDKAGPLDEEAIQKLKDEKMTLEAEH